MTRRKKLISNHLITWEQGFNPTTGEITGNKIVGTFYRMKIVITDNNIILSGSLHYLWNEINNDGSQNWDDFNFKDLSQVVMWLRGNLGIDPKQCSIQNLEYGVNVGIWKDPTDLITQNVIVWDGRVHGKNFTFINKGKFIEWLRRQYSQKIYDKGQQFNKESHILRWEKKIIKSEYLKSFGISLLSDIIDIAKLKSLANDLLKSFDKLLIVDSIDSPEQLSARERTTWTRGTNPKTWETIKTKHRSAKSRLNKNMGQIARKYGLDKTHYELRNRIKEKADQLLKCNVLTDLAEPILTGSKTESATFCHLDNMSECCTLFPLPDRPAPTSRTYGKRAPEDVPPHDSYKVKKLRNDISNPRNNRLRKLERDVYLLVMLDCLYLVNQIVKETDFKYLKEMSHIQRWKKLKEIIEKGLDENQNRSSRNG